MIKDWKKSQELITDFMNEFKYTHYNMGLKPDACKVLQCVELDKPFKIYTGQDIGLVFGDKIDHYYLYFGQGEDFPKEKEGYAWLSDEHSIFFFERPFENKVVNVLKKLLPNSNISYGKNDIYIDGTKNGASLRTGLQTQIGDEYYDKESKSIKKHTDSDSLTGMIYILRWDDLEGLNKEFDGVEHHKIRLATKEPLATLKDFLAPKGIDKQTFIQMLEDEV